jgi:hypothetical protein
MKEFESRSRRKGEQEGMIIKSSLRARKNQLNEGSDFQFRDSLVVIKRGN